MRGRKRPTDERARAVGIAVVAGAEEASRQTGIPARSIREWTDLPDFAELRQRSKDQVAEEWWAGIQTIARSIFRDIDRAPFRDRAIALGIVTEKMLLIRGEATSRTESRSLSDDLNDDEKGRLRDWIDGLDPAPAGQPADAAPDPG